MFQWGENFDTSIHENANFIENIYDLSHHFIFFSKISIFYFLFYIYFDKRDFLRF